MDRGVASGSGRWLAGRFSARQVDWFVFGAVALVSVPGVVHGVVQKGHPWVLALLPFSTVPVLWRRSRPGTALAVLGAAAMAWTIGLALGEVNQTTWFTGAGLIAGVYAAALYGNSRTRIVAFTSAVGVMGAAFGVVAATGTSRNLGHVAGLAFGYGIAWIGGDRVRAHRVYLAGLHDRAQRAESEREEQLRRAAEDERIRIARELHDVVAHNVSVVAVQAGAARRTVARRSADEVAESFGLIERTARTTLAELRALVGILRQGNAAAPTRVPLPGLSGLNELVEGARASGLSVELKTEGKASVPALVDLAAYRLVQEALTNAIKHAPGSHVGVRLRVLDDRVVVTVEDDGPGIGPGTSKGHGIIGMSERAAMAGGSFELGTAARGGVRVHAVLPFTESVQPTVVPDVPTDRPPLGAR